jgi:tripartite-type tricarboxylate transporter receptor subunit TctC
MKRHFSSQVRVALVALAVVALASAACTAAPSVTSAPSATSATSATSVTSVTSVPSATSAPKQEQWPTRPMTMVVAFAAGGGSDVVGRVQAKYLSQDLGQAIAIVNKGGGMQIPGVLSVLDSAPDGYTLLQELNTTSSLQSMTKDLPYKLEDRTYGPMMAAGPMAIAVGAGSPWNSLKDLVEAVKKDPSSLSWGYLGGTATADLTLMKLLVAGGVDISKTRAVSFDGTGPATTALAGGHIMLASDGAANMVSLRNAGTLKILAVSGDKRVPSLPDVPSAAESGFPTVDVITWFGVSGPKGLPKGILDKLDASAKKITEDPNFAQDMDKLGRYPQYMSPDKTRDFVMKEADAFKAVYDKLPKFQ